MSQETNEIGNKLWKCPLCGKIEESICKPMLCYSCRRYVEFKNLPMASWSVSRLPLPVIMGEPISREDIMEGLWSMYRDAVKLAKQDDSATTGFPDMEIILNYIEKHGLPPKEENAT